MTLRVATFNVRGCTGLDGRDGWPLRRARLREAARGLEVDVLACQEVMGPTHRLLLDGLQGWRAVLGPPTGRWPRVYNALYWRPAAGLRPVRHGGFWLGEAPDRRRPGWGSRTPRGVTWLELSTPQGPLVVASLHLDHESAPARSSAAPLVFERLAGLGCPPRPAVVMGDFNASPGSPAHRRWTSGPLRDAWLTAGAADDGRAFTFHGFAGVRHPAETRIDWILHSAGVEVSGIEVVDRRVRGRYPSDHHPVRATISLQAPGRGEPRAATTPG